MERFPKKNRTSLFKKILLEELPFGKEDEGGGIFDFLTKIWDLSKMPSEDARFKDASGDIFQHTINNTDWDYEALFITRLKLLEVEDEIFLKFIEILVSPETRKDRAGVIKFVSIINPFLEEIGLRLVIVDSVEGVPVYNVREKKEVGNLPSDMKDNNIPFIVLKQRTTRIPKQEKTPCFVLVKDHWNDFRLETLFDMYYCPDKDSPSVAMSQIKIMKKDEEVTTKAIPETFLTLDNNYCSLGQDIKFYVNLEKHLGTNFESVLFALKDCAFFPEILDRFEKDKIFQTSLIRGDSQERLLREAKHMIKGYDLANLYKFNYIFKPKYSSETVDVAFNFESESLLPHRIYALIGKNGTGKTQLISSLPMDLFKKNESAFSTKIPLFSKIITVSYSIFDKFELPQKNAEFNYVYCGLKESANKIMTEDALLERFYSSIEKINKNERTTKLRKILENFLEIELINYFFVEIKEIIDSDDLYNFAIERFTEHKDKLSSGQNIILYVITEIVANIRFDSLLLYDEPETHLHPNAISQLINAIYELVNEFESYCIIATHSPAIIQEIPSRDVYIIQRSNEAVSVRKIATESFGENLTTLTEEVFGNREISKQYKEIIKKLVTENKTFDEIISILETDNIPLSLNATIYIKSLIKNRDEKPKTLQ